jgi:3-oxoadipyl-CoA thiolase
MKTAYICDATRTPIGKYGGSLSGIRADDLAALAIKTLINRNNNLNTSDIDQVIFGCSNQAGEDNRNVARMALLLAGLPHTIPAVTVNRLCGSGMDAIAYASLLVATSNADIVVAGGVENMSRAPYAMNKADKAFDRNMAIYDTTLGWRFPNPIMEKLYGLDSMAETAENLADEMHISRNDQDHFAFLSQKKAKEAQNNGFFSEEIFPILINQPKGDPIIFDKDEHPRETSIEKLASLKPITREDGTITAGNSSGINDGAACLLIASEDAINKYNLNPLARIVGSQTAGVLPRIMGIGPVPATNKLLKKLNLTFDDIDLIELNEAFAAQALACIRSWQLQDDDPRINPQGGAIALGHPLGMSGARLVTTAVYQLKRNNLSRALTTMCIGVGQGISMILEKV